MNRGICQLSNVPVRKEPNSTSEMVTMLLFGETYSVTEQQKDWYKVQLDYDGYEGWINKRQYHTLTIEPKHITVASYFPLAHCSHQDELHWILPGSSLPDYTAGKFSINNELFQLEGINEPYNTSSVEQLAKQFLNTPYLWGGRSLLGIDCSGFTQVVFKITGIKLKRDAWQQAEQGEMVAFREAIQLGDLAFFDNEDGRIVHVGIMLSPNEIIHASGKVRIDKIDDFGIMNSDDNQYSHKLRFIKRIISG